MKKTFLFLAGAAIMFAACNNEPKKEEGPTQAQMDSTVNAKLAEQRVTDSIANAAKAAEAQRVADSTAKAEEAAKSKTSSKAKKTTKTTTAKEATPPPPPPPPANPKNARFEEKKSGEVNKADYERKKERFK